MEVYELPITPEESKNYPSFFYKLKALTLREWMRSYMPQEFLAGGIQLKKIRVQKDRLVVYYKRFRADDYKEL